MWRREINQDPKNAASLAVASSWFYDCLNHHDVCNEYASTKTKLPTRVIDLGTGVDALRLSLTNGAFGQFVALSYCWGDGAGAQLTRNTHDQFQQSISLHELPQTIQDAVLVTRGIGVRYLWVDALCIVQDSHDDWARESAQMHDIYGKASLVLVAEISASADEAFLRNRWVGPECSLPWTPHSQDPGASIHSAAIVHVGIMDNPWTNPVGHGGSYRRNGLGTVLPWRWKSRGWTLQEGVAASRTLSFEAYEMRWRCLHASVSESGEVIDHIVSRNSRLDDMLGKNKLVPANPDWADFAQRWGALTRLGHLVRQRVSTQEYDMLLMMFFDETLYELRKRSFTFPSDLLPAVAGFARVVENCLEGRGFYCAGLWSNNLASGLVWTASHNQQRTKQLQDIGGTRETNAPSWSWASVSTSSYDLSGNKELHMVGNGTLLTNVHFPSGISDTERFIPKSNVPLQFRAPFYRLCDNWMHLKEPFDRHDVFLSPFEHVLTTVYTQNHESDGECQCELHQKHKPYTGQHFAAVQVVDYDKKFSEAHRWIVRSLEEEEVQTARTTRFLILESVSGSERRQYRRIMLLDLHEGRLPRWNHGGKMLEWKGECERDKVTARDAWRLVKQTPWDEVEITLI